MRRKTTYRLIATELMYLFSEKPKIEGFVVYRWDGNAGVALLFVKSVQLFKKVDFGSRRGLYGVEAL